MTIRNSDFVTSIVFFMLGLLALFVLIPRGVAVPGSVKSYILSPDFWPRLIAIGVILSAVFLFVESFVIKKISPGQTEEEEEGSDYDYPEPVASVRSFILLIAMFAFYFALPALGLVAGSVLAMASMMIYFGERRWFLIIGLSAVLPVLLYVFFRHVASVPIPLGMYLS